MSRRLFFDIESNGLLVASGKIPAITMMHCLGAIDMDTGEELYYGPPVPSTHKLATPLLCNPTGTCEDGVRAIMEAGLAVGHNSVDFDFVALERLYPWFKRPVKAWDSYVMAKVVWPVDILAEPDFKRAYAKQMPMNLVKRHSLKAWGYRLGDNKDDYDGDKAKYPEPSDRPAKTDDERFDKRWSEWNAYMASYMLQDCRPGVKLWKLIETRVGWTAPSSVVWPEEVFWVEHEIARIIKQQELDGVHFSLTKGQALAAELRNEQARIEAILVDTFGSWWAAGETTTPAADRKVKLTQFPDVTKPRFGTTGKELAPYVGPPVCEYTKDAPFTPIEWVTFQPSSRDHLGQRLQAVYGWKPKMYGKNLKPTVDEGTLEEIPEAVMPKEVRELLINYFVVSKTLGTLAKGQKAWLHLVGDDGFMHGGMDTAGAITGRATHKNPNLSGVPAVRKEKVRQDDGSTVEVVVKGLRGRYGWECRELFDARPGWERTGIDASSLELIDLGHYLVPYDGGAFRDRVCDPTRDAHQEHATLADMTRGDAKTAIYLFIYGGGAYKLSLSLTVEDEEVLGLLGYRGLPMLLSNLVKRFDQTFVANLDDSQKARIAKARQIIMKFEKGIDGLTKLKEDVTKAGEKGWIVGMDGRRVYVRKAYSTLNTLLQSAGAQTCKLWIVLTHQALIAAGLVPGKDYVQVTWSHDEIQVDHRPGLGPQISKIAKDALREAGVLLKLRGEYRGEAKTGSDWAVCH